MTVVKQPAQFLLGIEGAVIDADLTDAFAALGEIDHQRAVTEERPQCPVLTEHGPCGGKIMRSGDAGGARGRHEITIGREIVQSRWAKVKAICHEGGDRVRHFLSSGASA